MAATAATVVALAVAAALLGRAPSARGEGVEGVEVPYDRGAVLVPAGAPGGLALPLAIEFFTDCVDPGEAPPFCGPPPARWARADTPVEFCTFQVNRPSFVSAEQFRQAVADTAAVWNAQEAAVGVRYIGDCPRFTRWAFDNDQNEIGFDDERDEASGMEAALARGAWLNLPTLLFPERREFEEFDIVLDGASLATVPLVCFQSVITHEMGHALGFGHSDDRADLMFESFNPRDVSTCRNEPSAAERARLQELYGIDRAPVVSAGADRVVDVGAAVTLRAIAADPEGGALSYAWEQISGPAVTLASSGSGASFVSPEQAGATLVFRVTAFDVFLHPDSDTVSVTVGAAESPPRLAPPLLSFEAGDGLDAAIGWGEVDGAATYQLCRQPPGVAIAEVCSNVASPVIDVSWEVLLGSTGLPTARRVFTSGDQITSLRACNSQGCSPAGAVPLAGGLRWPAWAVDYDYLALAFDVGRVRWTIIIVVNVSGPPRDFTLYTGPPEDPDRQRLKSCRDLSAGRRCVGFLRPGVEHFEVVTVVSEQEGTPTTEHRIRLR